MTIVKNNYKSLNNLFDEFFNNVPQTWNREANLTIPSVNIYETINGYQLELVAPGLQKEEFKVNLEKGLLSISYDKKNSNEEKEYKTLKKEFCLSSFKRSFTLDDNINNEGIHAKYENGILKLFLPKKDEVKVLTKEIAIS